MIPPLHECDLCHSVSHSSVTTSQPTISSTACGTTALPLFLSRSPSTLALALSRQGARGTHLADAPNAAVVAVAKPYMYAELPPRPAAVPAPKKPALENSLPAEPG